MHAIYQALNLEAQKSQLCNIIVARPEEKHEAKKAEAPAEEPVVTEKEVVAESAPAEEKDPTVQIPVTTQEEEVPEEGTKSKKTRKKAVKASE